MQMPNITMCGDIAENFDYFKASVRNVINSPSSSASCSQEK